MLNDATGWRILASFSKQSTAAAGQSAGTFLKTKKKERKKRITKARKNSESQLLALEVLKKKELYFKSLSGMEPDYFTLSFMNIKKKNQEGECGG